MAIIPWRDLCIDVALTTITTGVARGQSDGSGCRYGVARSSSSVLLFGGWNISIHEEEQRTSTFPLIALAATQCKSTAFVVRLAESRLR